jgi:sulfur carrier protein
MSEPLQGARAHAGDTPANVQFNGLTLHIDSHTSLAELLAQQGIAPASVATAVNGQFIPRAQREHLRLQEGDTVLTFQAIVGG